MKTLNKIFVLIFILILTFIFYGCSNSKNDSKANNLLDRFYLSSSNSYYGNNSFDGLQEVKPDSFIDQNHLLNKWTEYSTPYNYASSFKITYYYMVVDEIKIDIITYLNKKSIQFIYHYDEFTYSKYTYKYLSNCLYYETNNKDEANPNYFLFDDILKDYIEVNKTDFIIEDIYELIIK